MVYSNCVKEGGSSALGCWAACALCQTYEDVVPSLCHLESSLHLGGPVFVFVAISKYHFTPFIMLSAFAYYHFETPQS